MKAVMPVFFLKSMTFTVSQQILSGAPFSTEAYARAHACVPNTINRSQPNPKDRLHEIIFVVAKQVLRLISTPPLLLITKQ